MTIPGSSSRGCGRGGNDQGSRDSRRHRCSHRQGANPNQRRRGGCDPGFVALDPWQFYILANGDTAHKGGYHSCLRPGFCRHTQSSKASVFSTLRSASISAARGEDVWHSTSATECLFRQQCCYVGVVAFVHHRNCNFGNWTLSSYWEVGLKKRKLGHQRFEWTDHKLLASRRSEERPARGSGSQAVQRG